MPWRTDRPRLTSARWSGAYRCPRAATRRCSTYYGPTYYGSIYHGPPHHPRLYSPRLYSPWLHLLGARLRRGLAARQTGGKVRHGPTEAAALPHARTRCGDVLSVRWRHQAVRPASALRRRRLHTYLSPELPRAAAGERAQGRLVLPGLRRRQAGSQPSTTPYQPWQPRPSVTTRRGRAVT